MKTNIYTRKIELSAEKKAMIEKKLEKLSKFFDDSVSADVVVNTQKDKILYIN